MQYLRLSLRSFQRVQLWQQLKHTMSKRLLLINTGTCCTLYAVGDLFQQRIEGRTKTDWVRTARMATLGCFMGPVNHYWYVFLDRTIPGVAASIVGKKILADQLVMAPICCSVFYIGMCLLEGKGREGIKTELKAKFWQTYKRDWQLWPVAQAFNFYLVPPSLRVTYVNIVTLIWTVYLSYMKHKVVNSKTT